MGRNCEEVGFELEFLKGSFLSMGSGVDRVQYEWMEDERGVSRTMDLGRRSS